MWFEASRFERLGRRIVAAPRAVLLALAVVTAAASPGVIRSDFPVYGSARQSLPNDSSAGPLALHDVLLVELVCDAGLWSQDCLESVVSVTAALSARRDLVTAVDSLSARPRVVREEGGGLALRSFLAEVPSDPAALRRLRARGGDERALLRGVAASNERAALIQAKLVAGARPHEVAALVESLRAQSVGTPSVALAAVSSGLRAHELELAARRDLSRAAPLALLGLALLAGLASSSLRVGLGVAALAGAALLWCAAALALGGVALAGAAAIVPCLVCASCASLGFALVHRVSAEQRAGRDLGGAVTRAFGAAGTPLAAAALAGALAFGSLSVTSAPSVRPLALAGACGVAASVTLVGVGLPALLLALGRRRPPGKSGRGAPWSGLVDASLARLDGASRAPSRFRRGAVAVGLLALALFAMRGLRGDASALRFSPAAASVTDAVEPMSRDFGGSAVVRVVVDSGSAGGVAEPLFLERVQDLERRALQKPSVGSVRSLVDSAVLPAMRASHDDDPGFAVVPPTREQVEASYALFERYAPERMADGTDTERRRLAIDVIVDPRDPAALAALRLDLETEAASMFGRGETLRIVGPELGAARESELMLRAAPPAASTALALIAALAALTFESLVAGLLAALPAGAAVGIVFGAMGAFELPLDSLTSALVGFVALGAAGPAFLYLWRVREISAAGAELHVAVSVALRDVGRPIVEGALASVLFLGLLGSALPALRSFGALACAALAVSALASLVALPICIRTLRPKFLIASARSPQETLSCVRGAERAGEE